jgi:glycosyltransferase involved in cell wall biosynthesis
MKVVWFSHFIPYPPRGGSFQRTFNLLRCISKNHETHLVAMNLQGETPERVAEYAQELRKNCAEVEIWETPYPWRGARWWAQLALSPLFSHHYAARSLWSPQLGAKWREVLEKHAGALVNFETIDLALYFPTAQGFRKVLNHQNCESAMAERRAENEANPLKKAYLLHQARKIARLERHWCPRFDVNVAVSELDAQLLLSRAPGAHFHVVENGTDTDFFVPSETPPEPKSIVFAASLRWYPNVSAIRFFIREIWPLLKQRCAGTRLYLAGRSPAEAVRRCASEDPSITLVADPEDIRPWVARGSVFICPVLDGGGTRLKILDAMAMGKPVVSTGVGCEGLQVKPGENILVADSPEDFANSVLHLLQNDELRRRLSTNGRALVEKLYSWEVIAAHLEDAYSCARGPEGGKGQEAGCFAPAVA